MKRKIFALVMLVILMLAFAAPVYAATTDAGASPEAVQVQELSAEKSLLGDKAIACGIAISFAAGLGALGMGIATGKAAEGISRQPEVENKIRTMFMLGLVFMETAIIYALLVVILIIFVL